jgi:hypothetical protein
MAIRPEGAEAKSKHARTERLPSVAPTNSPAEGPHSLLLHGGWS